MTVTEQAARKDSVADIKLIAGATRRVASVTDEERRAQLDRIIAEKDAERLQLICVKDVLDKLFSRMDQRLIKERQEAVAELAKS